MRCPRKWRRPRLPRPDTSLLGDGHQSLASDRPQQGAGEAQACIRIMRPPLHCFTQDLERLAVVTKHGQDLDMHAKVSQHLSRCVHLLV